MNETASAGLATAPAVAVFEDVFEASYPRLLRMAYALLGDARRSDDVVQDAFIKAYLRWSRVGALDNPEMWIRRVIINDTTSLHRRVRSEARALLRLGARRAVPELVPSADYEQMWIVVGQLPQRQRQVVVLAYVEGFRTADVANLLGIGTETVKTHLQRAKATLADELREWR